MTAHCSPNLDRMLYFVLCRYGKAASWAERDVTDMDQRTTIAQIRSGDLPNVVTVLECNPVEHVCSDVTEEVMKLAGRWDFDPPHLSPSERLEAMRDHCRDQRKNEVVG
jgi:hypothetical protein